MAELQGKLGELSFTLQITRKDTGKVEEYEMTSSITDEKTHEQLLKEYDDGSHTQHSK